MTERVDFDAYSERYNTLLKERTSFFSSNDAYFAWYKVARVKSGLSRPVNRILEHGCGIGRNIPFLREAFPQAEVIGTDISRASLEVARRANPEVDFFCEEDTPSHLGLFDLIFIAGVYHHVPLKQRPILSHLLYQRLATRGDVFVFEHNPFNPVTRRIVSTCPYDKDAVLVYPHQLKRYLLAEGLHHLVTRYCLFVPPGLASPARFEHRLGWLPLGGQYFIQASK